LLVIIVRHGETDYNKKRLFQGRLQIRLNEKGKAQAVQLAKSLRQYKITRIYSSNLSRARETAEIINKSFSLPVIIDARLDERDWGIWENQNRDEMLKQIPASGNIWNEENLDTNPYKGETTRNLMARCAQFLNYIVENNSAADVVLVVTHGGPMRMILGIIKGLHDEQYLRQEIENGQMLIIRYENSMFIKAIRSIDNNHC
jgi:broad specificity phosphatase PhoE